MKLLLIINCFKMLKSKQSSCSYSKRIVVCFVRLPFHPIQLSHLVLKQRVSWVTQAIVPSVLQSIPVKVAQFVRHNREGEGWGGVKGGGANALRALELDGFSECHRLKNRHIVWIEYFQEAS